MLSVITITRNDPAGLRATLGSLAPLLTSGVKWQHIVVDASPIETRPVLESLDARWPLVHVEAPPRGIYAAFNDGIARATGNTVWFLNGGDRLRDVGTLARLLSRLDARPDIAMVCAAVDGMRDGKFQYTHVPQREFEANLTGRNAICHQGVLYRRSVLQELGDYSTRYQIAGDYEHHLRCLSKHLAIECRPERLAEYDMSGASTNWRLALREFREALQEHENEVSTRFYRRASGRLRVEWLRIYVVKRLAHSPLSGVLEPVWLRWKRARAAKAGAGE